MSIYINSLLIYDVFFLRHKLTHILLSGPHPKSCPARREVLLVLEGALFLVPFAVLRTTSNGQEEYLCERFSLMALPSLGALRHSSRPRGKNHSNGGGVIESGTRPSSPGLSALVVGSPRLPPDVSELYSWSSMPAGSQTEAVLVAEMLQGQALLGAQVHIFNILFLIY